MTALDPLAIFRALATHEVDAVVVGLTAAVLHGYPETTVDVDIVPSLDVTNAERLAAALEELDARHHGIDRGPSDRDFIGLRQVLTFDTSAGRLDVIPFAIGVGDYLELAQRATELDLGGFTVTVASLDDVIASKEAAGRPKDLRRLEGLRAFRGRRQA